MSLDHKIELIQFDGTNYTLWKFGLDMALASKGLTGHADGTVSRPSRAEDAVEWTKRDAQAQLIINQSVTNNHKPLLFGCGTAHKMIEKLNAAYAQNSQLAKQSAWQRFLEHRMDPHMPIATHLAKVELLAKQLKDMGETVSDGCVVTQVLRSLPEKYRGFTMAWNLMEPYRQTLNTLTEMLLCEDSAMTARDQTKAAFKANLKSSQGKTKAEGPKNKVKCWACNETGHLKRNCPRKKSGQAKTENGNIGSTANSKMAFPCMAVGLDPDSNDHWICDSGSSCHMTNRRDWLRNLEPCKEAIKVANQEQMWSCGRGSIDILAYINGQWKERELKNVLLVPDLDQNLFSVPTMRRQGWLMREEHGTVTWMQNGQVACTAAFDGNIYVMQFKVDERVAMSALAELRVLHERMGHVNAAAIIDTIKRGAVEGVTLTGNATGFTCDVCDQSKQVRKQLPVIVDQRSSEMCGVIHADVCGPMPKDSPGGARFFLVLKDDNTSFRRVYFMRHKSEVATAWKTFVTEAERQTNGKVKALRSDNGTEFVNAEMDEFNRSKGIRHEKSAPYTAASNGRAEREIRSLVDLARSMLLGSGLPETLWAEAVNTAAYVLNRTINKNISDKTPFEAWLGKKPFVGHMRVFGSVAYGHVNKVLRKKFDATGRKMVLVGYDGESRVYRLWDIVQHEVRLYRHATIRDGLMIKGEPEKLTCEFWFGNEESPLESVGAEKQNKNNLCEQQTQSGDAETRKQVANGKSAEEHRRSSRQHGGQNHMMLDDRGRPIPITYDGSRPKPVTGLTHIAMLAEVIINDTPPDHKAALESPEASDWQRAFEEELKAHERNGTWTLVDPEPGAKVIDNKWVLRIKRKQDGSVDRFRARLVARGFRQIKGIDYDETFSPVVRYESVRVLLAIAAEQDMEIVQMDVKTAYLYGELEKPVYMKQPAGFEDPKQPEKVCKLLKSIYGLKISGRVWNRKFVSVLTTFGFLQLDGDHCVFRGTYDGTIVYLCIYVDDGLVMSKKLSAVNAVLKALSDEFNIMFGEAECFVGMEIRRDRSQKIITISQGVYIQKLLERFGMGDAKPVMTPMNVGESLGRWESNVEGIPYQEAIGSLLFAAMVSRPDIANAVGILSRYLSAFDEQHWLAVKRVLRYLKGTKDYGLVFGGNCSGETIGFTDADYAGDRDTRRSTTGFVFLMNGSAVTWASQRQHVVALSTTEAEYMALATGARDAIWLQDFTIELQLPKKPVPIYVDNQGAIRLAGNPEFHRRTKHIDVRFHFVRDEIERGRIKINYIESKTNVADILTKPLARQQFQFLRDKMGVSDVQERLDRKWE